MSGRFFFFFWEWLYQFFHINSQLINFMFFFVQYMDKYRSILSSFTYLAGCFFTSFHCDLCWIFANIEPKTKTSSKWWFLILNWISETEKWNSHKQWMLNGHCKTFKCCVEKYSIYITQQKIELTDSIFGHMSAFNTILYSNCSQALKLHRKVNSFSTVQRGD